MAQRVMSNYTCTLSEGDLDKAKRELTEDPETRKMEIQTLRERLLRYPGLNSRLDDVFLLQFLRPRKFDQERTFTLIVNYYKLKKENEDIYAEMTPFTVKNFLDDGVLYVLPHAGRLGESVIVCRSDIWDTDKYPFETMFRTNYLLMSTLIEAEEAQVHGVRVIVDLEGFGWNHVTVMSPSQLQKMVSMVQDAFPLRLKGIHYVHEHSIFDFFFTILKPFLNQKLAGRINFHGEKYEGLHQFIDPEHLPEKYGGKQPTQGGHKFNKRVFEKQLDFEEDMKFGFVSMTIKQESKKSTDAMENLPGTFKKLNVD